MMKNNEEYEYVPKPKVHCSGCDDFHFTEDVIVENIEFIAYGEDVLTFCCKNDPVNQSVFRKGIIVI